MCVSAKVETCTFLKESITPLNNSYYLMILSHFGRKYANPLPLTMHLNLEFHLWWVEDKPQYQHLAAIKVQTMKQG